MPELLYLSSADVESLVDARDVVRVAEETIRADMEGKVSFSDPRVLLLRPKGFGTRFRAKLCSLDYAGVTGFRIMGAGPAEDEEVHAPLRLMTLSDSTTGEFLALVDERWSYALRTGSMAAVALKYTAPPETEEMGLVGTGHMARGTLHAVRAQFPGLRRVLVFSRRPDARRAFAERLAGELDGLEVTPVESAEEVLARADMVVTATDSETPFIRTAWLRPGCTVYSMGGGQELDDDSYTSVDKLVVDDWEQIIIKPDFKRLARAGALSMANVHADLGQLVTGARPGRETPMERIVIRTEGLVSIDVSLAHYLYQQARARGIGQRIQA